MALNKVMVASNVGGHRELIRDGETGNLFVAGDVNDLAKTVLRVLENRAAWPSQIAAGRKFVEQERSWKTVWHVTCRSMRNLSPGTPFQD